jgi:hypothetical protein
MKRVLPPPDSGGARFSFISTLFSFVGSPMAIPNFGIFSLTVVL